MCVEELVKLCTRTEEKYPGFKKYDFFQIVDGTQMFSEKRIVGSGGFGTVYKVNVNRNVNPLVYCKIPPKPYCQPFQGELSDGAIVAIKRFEHGTDFSSELQLLCLHHINIIKLLGWCVHRQERILVYEFMPNHSLDRIIFGMYVLMTIYSCLLRCSFSMPQ
jgi:serine/threonine protein kinase